MQKNLSSKQSKASLPIQSQKRKASAPSSVDQIPLKPFLKWPGGKRWLIEDHRHLLPKRINGRYIEPFLGSGAVFFHLRPRTAILSDINSELIEAYSNVKRAHRKIVARLSVHHVQHAIDPERYYDIRAEIPDSAQERAARMLYLNRTCFNGIYRVNQKGEFNVPRGSKTKVLMPDDMWPEWSKALHNAQLRNSDFEPVIDEARKGDFLFVDPPYTVHHNMNGFIKYNEVMFSWDDQVRLAQAMDRARRRGVRILMTNANHESVRALYGTGFKKTTVSRFSSVSGKSEGRSSFEELIITI